MKRFFKNLSKNQTFISVLGSLIIACSIGSYTLAQNLELDKNTTAETSKVFEIMGDVTGTLNIFMANQDAEKTENFGAAFLYNSNNPIFTNGLRAGENALQIIDSSGNLVTSNTGTFAGTTITASGETILEGLTYGSGALELATSTGTTILTEAQLLADSLLEITVNTGTAATIQLPATSTMATLMNGESKHRSWLIHNATSSTMAMTITKGGGIDLIGVTTDNDLIDATEYAELECWRQVDTDVTCIISELLHVD